MLFNIDLTRLEGDCNFLTDNIFDMFK